LKKEKELVVKAVEVDATTARTVSATA
jgi:hypothetical protein